MKTKSASRKERSSCNVGIRPTTADKARDVVFWTPGLSLSDLVERGVVHEIARREREHGKPFPRRTERELKRGRRAGQRNGS